MSIFHTDTCKFRRSTKRRGYVMKSGRQMNHALCQHGGQSKGWPSSNFYRVKRPEVVCTRNELTAVRHGRSRLKARRSRKAEIWVRIPTTRNSISGTTVIGKPVYGSQPLGRIHQSTSILEGSIPSVPAISMQRESYETLGHWRLNARRGNRSVPSCPVRKELLHGSISAPSNSAQRARNAGRLRDWLPKMTGSRYFSHPLAPPLTGSPSLISTEAMR